jgi:hypothetical protein
MRIQRKKIIALAILLFLLCTAFPATVRSQSDIPLTVSRAVWGQNLNSPVNVYPGDSGVSLTVEVQNLSTNHTIKGVSGVLMLNNGPFTDIYGNLNATATGQPTIGEILNPTDEIKPKGFLTMTFSLDIADNALPGTYVLDLTVAYSADEGTDFVEGKPQSLNVTCTVSPLESTVTVSASPASLERGEQVKITGSIQPAYENVNLNLAFQDPNGKKFNQLLKTKLDGSFNTSYIPEVEGTWTVNASWSGNEECLGNWGSTTFEVQLPVSLEMTLSNDRLRAGYDNQLNITVKNDGDVALSALEFSFSVPAPLISEGKSQWSLNYLQAGGSFSIPVVVYVPSSSIGNTYNSGLTASCRDDYGQSQTYNFAVGLIIVGNVELSVYSNAVKPQLVGNGSKVEITTTLLNRGTVPALYVNASILPNAILDLTSESSAYIGDVDENSQAPFTVAANVSKDTPTGSYPVTLRIYYRNDQNVDNSFDFTFNLQVLSDSKTETAKNDFNSYEIALVLATIVVAAVATVVVYRRQISRQRKKRADK